MGRALASEFWTIEPLLAVDLRVLDEQGWLISTADVDIEVAGEMVTASWDGDSYRARFNRDDTTVESIDVMVVVEGFETTTRTLTFPHRPPFDIPDRVEGDEDLVIPFDDGAYDTVHWVMRSSATAASPPPGENDLGDDLPALGEWSASSAPITISDTLLPGPQSDWLVGIVGIVDDNDIAVGTIGWDSTRNYDPVPSFR